MQSADSVVSKYQKQIDKLTLMLMWTWQAGGLLEAYKKRLDDLTPTTDKQESGRTIQDCEAYAISSVNFFLRCFRDQPSTYLEIEKVTGDPELLTCYKEIDKLRNDEHVHWKGAMTALTVRYSFEQDDPRSITFAQEIQLESVV